jgi:hypothetical protein
MKNIFSVLHSFRMKTAGFTDRKSAHIPDGIWDMRQGIAFGFWLISECGVSVKQARLRPFL